MFTLAKIFSILTEPYYLALTLVLLAVALRLVRRGQRLRRWLVITASVVLLLFSLGPVANLLLYPLETAHERPAKLPDKVGAVVMLGGVTKRPVLSPSYYELVESSDRFVEALRLAHRRPEAVLVITGGSSSIVNDRYREADALGALAEELGVAKSRIRMDRDSRNTHENALHTRRLLRRIKGPLVLVTSAAHMPRSVACFRKVGLSVIPWPVDFQRTHSGPGAWIPKPQTVLRSNAALHEYFGWLAYWLADYV